ncbi:MAG TPA: hypothetical protein VM537_10935 [Anaerolineae bacterium]|jgi:hypothetical protein|nr:hypothetical protein [Anaerolineae bacterium]
MSKSEMSAPTLDELFEMAAGTYEHVAFALIKTHSGKATEVREQVSAITGVRWAVETVGTSYSVIAAVRVDEYRTLHDVFAQMRAIDGVKNPDKALVVGLRPHNGWP